MASLRRQNDELRESILSRVEASLYHSKKLELGVELQMEVKKEKQHIPELPAFNKRESREESEALESGRYTLRMKDKLKGATEIERLQIATHGIPKIPLSLLKNRNEHEIVPISRKLHTELNSEILDQRKAGNSGPGAGVDSRRFQRPHSNANQEASHMITDQQANMHGSSCSFESLEDYYPAENYEKMGEIYQIQKDDKRLDLGMSISPRTLEKTGVIDLERNTTCGKNHIQSFNNLKRWTNYQNSSSYRQTQLQPSPRPRYIQAIEKN